MAIKVQNINIRGAIFDMDRLILDNISIYKKIYTEVVKKKWAITLKMKSINAC